MVDAERHYRATQRVPRAFKLDAPPLPALTIIQDTREQSPPPWPDGVVAEECALATGDYSTPLLADIAAVERKSPGDFTSTLTHGRERWDREVQRAQDELEWFCVVVEGSLEACCEQAPGVHPRAILGSVSSLVAKGFPVSFVSGPAAAGFHIAGILRRWEARMAQLTPPPPLVHRIRDAAQKALARRSLHPYSADRLAARLAAYGG